MAAIITDDFRKNLAQQIVDEIASTATDVPEYYIGIGKSDPWEDVINNELVAGYSPAVPDGSIREKEEVKENLIGMIKLDAGNRVIPRITYSLNQVYKRYDPSDPTCFIPTLSGSTTLNPCYVVHQEKIWVCLRNKTSASTPTGVATTANDAPQADVSDNAYALAGGGTTGEHYKWAYIADVLDEVSGFNTTQFIEVSSNDLTSDNATDATAATGGLLYGIKIINEGSNYTTGTITVTIQGAPLSKADVAITVDASDIVAGQLKNLDLGDNGLAGTNWTDASVTITDSGNGSGAEAVALIAPIEGFAFNAAKTLPSYYVGLEASLKGNLDGDAPIINYRQVSLVRGLESELRTADSISNTADTGEYEAAATLDTLRYFVTTSQVSGSTAITPGDVIEQTATGARAFVDHIQVNPSNSSEYLVFFHQNNNDIVNKAAFTATASTINILPRTKAINSSVGSNIITGANYSSIGNAEYNRNTGEVMFYENRTPITRSSQQTEDIKLVIQL